MKSTLHRFVVKALPAAPLALAAIPAANAQIVYTNPTDASNTDNVYNSFLYVSMGDPLNSPGMGSASASSISPYSFQFYMGGSNKSYIRFGSGSGIVSTPTQLTRLGQNATIGAGSAWTTNNSFFLSGASPITGDSDNYLGVKFEDGSSQTHYGWIRVSLFESENSSIFTVYDFAYNATPGASILAGQTAIPEPSTYAVMAGLLAGSAALYRRRQQKQAAA